ncbi:hypothetical protein Tco_1482901 [Tanacetum coccineum]
MGCTERWFYELETMGDSGMVLAPRGIEYPVGCRFKRKEWGRGKSADIQLYADIANWTGLLWILDKFDDWYLILNMSSKYTCADIASWMSLLWILEQLFGIFQEDMLRAVKKLMGLLQLLVFRAYCLLRRFFNEAELLDGSKHCFLFLWLVEKV